MTVMDRLLSLILICVIALGVAQGQEQAIGPVINEFMAANASAIPLQEGQILDEDGESSDWIEIYNPMPETIDLGNWYLTDDTDDLTKWRFPDRLLLEAHGYLVVFASGKDRLSNPLHTNFKLSSEGEYLALVQNDRTTVADEYGPTYPEQLPNISYGRGQYEGSFITTGSIATYNVPSRQEANVDWTSVTFNDAAWSKSETPLGFSPTPELTNTDVGTPGSEGFYYIQEGVYIVQGDGADIGNRSDTFHYVYARLRGDGEITVHVAALVASNSSALAGVMIRENLTTGAKHATQVVTSSNGVAFHQRVTTDGTSTVKRTNGYGSPLWLRIVRGGDTFSGYYSTDGTNWTLQDSAVIDMALDTYIGLCVNSHAFRAPSTALFDVLQFDSSKNLALKETMLGNNASLRARFPFDAEEVDAFDSLQLDLQYEDGFVAYLNGTEIARDNFSGTLQWDSAADSDRSNLLIAESVLLDLTEQRDLLRDGRNVLAIQVLNDDPSDEMLRISPELTAGGDVIVSQYFATPSPGQPNITGALDVVAKPQFSYERGLYDHPFSLELSCDTIGVTLRYTLDGTAPTATSGYVYTGPIDVTTTSYIRAAGFRAGWMASDVVTHTYIFPQDVVSQPDTPAGFPNRWGSQTADYEMDPQIVEDVDYGPYIPAALASLPTMSLVVSTDDLFGSNGIYTNWDSSGDAWERPASVELIYPDGSEGMHVNCGIRIYGGVGRREAKKSFRLNFTRQYGPTKLRYSLFGDDAVDEFDQIILRANFNDAYTWGGNRSQYIRDEFVRRLQWSMGHPAPHGNFVHLYINGLYWGLYNPAERPEASFAASYFGGDKEDWDALNSARPIGDSSTTTWNALLSFVRQGIETNEIYQRLQGNNPDGTRNPDYVDYLDIENYIAYMILNLYVGNADWPGHNWYAAMNRVETSGWKCFSWDAEWVVNMNSSLSVNRTSVNNSLCEPYARLRDYIEFRMAFADQAQKYFFNNGPLYVDPDNPQWDPSNPDRNRPAAIYAELADEIELAMLGESARWGDAVSGSPYRIEQWQQERDYILGTYMPQRSEIVLDQFRSAGLYPTVDAPVFSPQHGGHIASDETLGISATQGTVYYTLDGTDPRQPSWDSSNDEIITLLTEAAPKRVLVPSVANGGNLVSHTPPGFDVTYYKANINVTSLAIAEQVIGNTQYQAATATEQASFINYFNTGTPGNFDNDRPFPGTTMDADVEDFVILVTGLVHIPSAGQWTVGVNSDDGFGLALTDGRNTYTSSYPDPRGPADTLTVFNITSAGQYFLRLVYYERGGGSELELFAAQGSHVSFNSSRFRLVGDVANGGLQVGGTDVWFTEGFDDSTWTAGTGGVGYENSSGYEPYFDIDVQSEMSGQNTSCFIRIPFTAEAAVFSNMMLRIRYDDGFIAYLNGTEVARRNFTGQPAWNSTASASNGDDAAIALQSIDVSQYAHLLRQGSNLLAIHGLNVSTDSSDFLISAELVAGEISQGGISSTAIQYTGPVTLADSTHVKARAYTGQWSALSEATFAVGPVAESLRISEIMYHPAETGQPDDPNTEYIELTNIGNEPISLNLVKFTDGVDFTFDSIGLAPSEYVLIVRDITAFEAKYGQDFPIVGQYTGSLDNGGERIELQDAAGQIIHHFRYRDNWYDITDGADFSLTVTDLTATDPEALDDKSTWRPSAYPGGSPGFDDTGVIPNLGAVVINELMANPDSGQPDWIELHNTTNQTINLGGWFLSDDADDLTKYEIPQDTTIAPGGHIVFYQDEDFTFGLSREGETVYLHSGLDGVITGYIEQERFDASETGVSLGRYLKSTGAYNFVPLSLPTPGATNADPKAGPIVINEIMYNPVLSPDAEYVELLNISDTAVTLFDIVRDAPWRFTDNPDDPAIIVEFPIDEPITLGPGQFLLLVKDLTAFNTLYIVPTNVPVFEWMEGRLSNGSDKIQLSKPGDQEDDGPRSWIRVDRVVYSDGSHPDDFTAGVDPWPIQADGQGAALSRISPQAYGNDPINWQASIPSPGYTNP